MILNMINSKIFKTLVIAFLMIITSITVQAQIDLDSPFGKPKKEEYPQPILETLAKQRIEEEKEDYQKLLKRGEEAVKLSEQLERSYAINNQLSSDDKEKLKDLEKLLKKIRDDLGGDDDDEEEFKEKPGSMKEAIKTLKQNTVDLYEEIKQTSRHTISVVAIESSNFVLKIVKFLRFGD